MEILKIISELNACNVFMRLDDKQIRLVGQTDQLPMELISEIRKQKAALIQFLEGTSGSSISKTVEAVSYPITSAQKRMWLLNQLSDTSAAFNIPFSLSIKGTLDFSLLNQALLQLLERHESLRTVFREVAKEEIHQVVKSIEKIDFQLIERNFSDLKDSRLHVHEAIQQLASYQFDLEDECLIKAEAYQLGDSDTILTFCIHHIISDGWSMEVLVREVLTIYQNLINHRPALPALTIQYKDYAVWVKKQFSGPEMQKQEAYWLNRFDGELSKFDLPIANTRPKIKTYEGNQFEYQLPNSLLNELKSFSEQAGGTLFMTLMAGLNALFFRYTGVRDIILGTPIAGREHPELERQIGLFLNTLAIRTQIGRDCSFTQLFDEQKKNLLDAYANQNYPFDELVGKLALKRDTSRSALFDIMVVLQSQRSTEVTDHIDIKGLDISVYKDAKRKVSQLDLLFSFEENENGLLLNLEYNTSLFTEERLLQLVQHLHNLLQSAIAEPLKPVDKLSYLNVEEIQYQLSALQGTSVDYEKEETVLDLVLAQTGLTPDHTAVIFEDRELTYQELYHISNQLAHYLKDKCQIQRGDLVGVKVPRTEWLVISLLAIWKTGAAYVPFDANYPEERIHYIQKDSNCKATIDDSLLAEFQLTKEGYSAHLPLIELKTNDLAYIIYTSGSTGMPKGVMIEHRNAVELIRWAWQEYNPDTFNIVYQATSHCFDLSVYELFYSLSIGKTVRVLSNPLEIEEYLDKDKHNNVLLNTVPSVVKSLVDRNVSLQSVKVLNMAGETIPVSVIPPLLKYDMVIRNCYGPSEDTTYSSSFQILNDTFDTIPIGKPLYNTQFYVLDENLELLPVGGKGEIFIAGKGLARGYLNQPELTEERFVSNPFGEGKLYRTGDLGRWLPDGNLVFLGREDAQVKLNGYRIELSEIEIALTKEENVNEAVVLVKENALNEKVLVAYFTADNQQPASLLKSTLKRKLPVYMIPQQFIQLDEFPLNANGKIDRNKLPNLTDGLATAGDIAFENPENEMQQFILQLVKSALSNPLIKIGINDSLFDVGITSIKLMGLRTEIVKKYQVDVKIVKFFEYPTVKEFSNYLVSCLSPNGKDKPCETDELEEEDVFDLFE